MHASIEQLLALRDAEPLDTHWAEHVRRCPRCTAELENLAERRSALAALPQLEAPAGSWQRIVTEARSQSAPSSGAAVSVIGGLGLVAAVVLTVVVLRGEIGADVARPAAPAVRGAPFTVTTLSAAPGGAALAAQTAALMAESRRLEQAVRTLTATSPRVVSASTALTLAQLEDQLALLDYRLSRGGELLDQNDVQRLWGSRVNLMRSLYQVRSAEVQARNARITPVRHVNF